jgi:hypothetical protein
MPFLCQMRALATAVAVLVAATVSLAGAARAEAAFRCFGEFKPGYKRHEIDRSRQVRLYWRSEVGFPKDDGSVIACWRRTGHTFELGGDGAGSDIGSFAIRGRFVAFSSDEYNRGSSDTTIGVTVVDVRERRIVHEWRYTQYSGLTDRTVPLRVHKRHLRTNGSLAVLVGPYSDPAITTRSTRCASPTGTAAAFWTAAGRSIPDRCRLAPARSPGFTERSPAPRPSTERAAPSRRTPGEPGAATPADVPPPADARR